jgi:hypothetical protein
MAGPTWSLHRANTNRRDAAVIFLSMTLLQPATSVAHKSWQGAFCFEELHDSVIWMDPWFGQLGMHRINDDDTDKLLHYFLIW